MLGLLRAGVLCCVQGMPRLQEHTQRAVAGMCRGSGRALQGTALKHASNPDNQIHMLPSSMELRCPLCSLLLPGQLSHVAAPSQHGTVQMEDNLKAGKWGATEDPRPHLERELAAVAEKAGGQIAELERSYARGLDSLLDAQSAAGAAIDLRFLLLQVNFTDFYKNAIDDGA